MNQQIDEPEANNESTDNGTKFSIGFKFDISHVASLSPKQIKVILSCLSILAGVIGKNYLNYQNKSINIPYASRNSTVVECSNDQDCPLSTQSKLYEINHREKMEHVLASKNFENPIVDQGKIEEEDSEKSSTTSKITKLAVIQFAEDDIYSQGIAASCISSDFFGKRVELKDPTNIENNTVVNLTNPINCLANKKSIACEGDLIIHIPFSEASKLYPNSYNPEKQINKLPSCSFANVILLD